MQPASAWLYKKQAAMQRFPAPRLGQAEASSSTAIAVWRLAQDRNVLPLPGSGHAHTQIDILLKSALAQTPNRRHDVMYLSGNSYTTACTHRRCKLTLAQLRVAISRRAVRLRRRRGTRLLVDIRQRGWRCVAGTRRPAGRERCGQPLVVAERLRLAPATLRLLLLLPSLQGLRHVPWHQSLAMQRLGRSTTDSCNTRRGTKTKMRELRNAHARASRAAKHNLADAHSRARVKQGGVACSPGLAKILKK